MRTARSAPAPARFSPGGGRLVGIDLARFLAICGMVVAHVRVIDWAADKPLNTVFDGNPSTLFAVLGGVSVVLATRRYLVAGDVAAARWSLFARGGIVVLIGLLLGLLEDAPAVVVLVPFGVAMWGAIPFLRVRS
ncbi:acyltransferase, partial [Leucobacter sp. M11]|nr:acyltransferase [Leucobacter sp. M11]